MPESSHKLDDVSPGSRQRLPELDGVRGCAILLVLVWHYLQNQIRADAGSSLAYFKQFIGFTWSGVDLFFVLSGFLIAGILLDNCEKSNYFKAFYIRRICRIFPLYYMNLGLFLLFAWVHVDDIAVFRAMFEGNGVSLWTYFTFTQNISMGLNNSLGVNWFAVTWSLAVEEQFYLFFPFIVRYFPRRDLPLVFIWVAVLAVYLRYSIPGLSAYINTAWRVDSLMMGALMAYYFREPVFLALAHKYRTIVSTAFLFSVAGVVIINMYGGMRLGGVFTHSYLAITSALLIACVLLNRNGIIANIFRARWLMWLGSISYGVYIIHTVVSRFVHGFIRGEPPAMHAIPDVATTLFALLLTLGIAHFSYNWFESRFIRFGHTVRYDAH